MRTIVDIPEHVLAALDSLCQRERISRAEAIRRAVDIYLRQSQPQQDSDAFGIWRHRKTQGREYEDALRDEWDSNESGC